MQTEEPQDLLRHSYKPNATMGLNTPSTQFGMSRSNARERLPSHSVYAIADKRAGGKKAPKKYRKYHKNSKTKKQKPAGNIASRAMHYVKNAIARILP